MRFDARRRTLVKALGVAPLMLYADHPLAGTLWDLNASTETSKAALLRTLHDARFRLLGEVHDNAGQHAIQRDLLAALGASGLKPAVAFEQFDRQHDKALQERQVAGDLSAEDVTTAVQFNRKGWNWEFYRPLVEVALLHRMVMRAANLSRADAAAIVRQPAQAKLEGPWTAQKEYLLRDVIFQGHCRAMPESMMPGMVAAQRSRDATLAEALLEPARDGAVLIAGNGHVRRDLGVPLHLPAGQSVSVGLLEVEAGRNDLRDYLTPGGDAPYDFAWFTPQAQRDDPCQALLKR